MTADTLIARLEGAGEGSRELDAHLFAMAQGGRIHWIDPVDGDLVWEKPIDGMWIRHPSSLRKMPAYTASLDAAIALVTRLLPGAKISLFVGHLTSAKDGSGARAQVIRGRGPKCPHTGIRWPRMEGECLYAATPALALCIAALKALEAKKAPTSGRGT